MFGLKLRQYLDSFGVHYTFLDHTAAFTAAETAAAAHVHGKELAKPVIVRINGELAMVVVPATHAVDLGLLAAATGAKSVELADEASFQDLFPDCEPGAMPPFGHLYGLETYASYGLMEDTDVLFNAGTHRRLMKMSLGDYTRMARPLFANISRPAEAAIA